MWPGQQAIERLLLLLWLSFAGALAVDVDAWAAQPVGMRSANAKQKYVHMCVCSVEL